MVGVPCLTSITFGAFSYGTILHWQCSYIKRSIVMVPKSNKFSGDDLSLVVGVRRRIDLKTNEVVVLSLVEDGGLLSSILDGTILQASHFGAFLFSSLAMVITSSAVSLWFKRATNSVVIFPTTV